METISTREGLFFSVVAAMYAMFLLACASCGGGKRSERKGLDEGTVSRIDEAVAAAMGKYKAPGAMVSELASLRSWSKALVSGELLKASTREVMTAETKPLPYTEEYFGYPMRYGLAIIDFGGWLGHSGMEVGYTPPCSNCPRGTPRWWFFSTGRISRRPACGCSCRLRRPFSRTRLHGRCFHVLGLAPSLRVAGRSTRVS